MKPLYVIQFDPPSVTGIVQVVVDAVEMPYLSLDGGGNLKRPVWETLGESHCILAVERFSYCGELEVGGT